MESKDIKSTPPGFREITNEERKLAAERVISDSGNDPIIRENMKNIIDSEVKGMDQASSDPIEDEIKKQIKEKHVQADDNQSIPSTPDISLKRIGSIIKDGFSLVRKIFKKEHLRWVILLLLAILIGILIGSLIVPEPLPIVL